MAGGRSVLQDWVHGLSFMQQTVLLAVVRGPDGFEKHHPVKPLLRWYRRCILLSAMDGRALTNEYEPGGGSFSGPLPVDITLDQQLDAFMRTMDQVPIHFWLHMMHAFEIVGYKHPDEQIGAFFLKAYTRMAHAMHVWPETEEQLDQRLGDNREGWLKRGDRAIDGGNNG